jgi:hypothetical protein
MDLWFNAKSLREPAKAKARLHEMPIEAGRDTQPEPKRPPQTRA